MQNHAVRKIDVKTGIITTIAGTGKPGYSGDGGPADHAQLKQPHSIQFSPDGKHLYICDIGNNVIRRVDMKTKRIETFAGTGKAGVTPDGAPIKGTPLKGPRSIDFDSAGNLSVCTREGNQVFKFDLKADKIHLVVGNGKKGFDHAPAPAKQATLNGPKGVAVDAKGDAWIVDTESHTIRVYRAKTDTLELAIGTGKKHDGPDGDPLKCGLARPMASGSTRTAPSSSAIPRTTACASCGNKPRCSRAAPSSRNALLAGAWHGAVGGPSPRRLT
jgi:DNA-binding beta-propeller fold protein YncE